MRNESRLGYVDSLRVWAIAFVFIAHTAEVFNPWDSWHIVNGTRSRVLGELAVIAAPWAMPLLMLLAGVSAWFSLQHRDNQEYVRDRVGRLLLPLIIGTLVLVPPQVYLERRLSGAFRGSLLAFYPHFFDGIYPNGNLSWHHLWFLAHLFIYALVTLPLFRYLQHDRGTRALRWLARVAASPGGVLWLSVPLIAERNALWGLFPERHMLTSDWSNHALLLVAYIYGFLLAATPWLGRAIDAQWPRMFIVAVGGTAALMVGSWRGLLPGALPPPYSFMYLGFWTLYSICAWAWMVTLLGLGRQLMNRESPMVRYGRRTGYAVYLVHQPIIVAIAYLIVQTSLTVGEKFALLFVTSAPATILCAELLIRAPFMRGLAVASASQTKSRAFGAHRHARRATGHGLDVDAVDMVAARRRVVVSESGRHQ